MRTIHCILALAAALSLATGSRAETAAAPEAEPPATAAAAGPATDGEVRKIDRAQGKLTLRHGPIQNLDMPGMTMVFRVAEPQMLDAVKEGDKVKFSADKVNGAFTVTAIEAVR